MVKLSYLSPPPSPNSSIPTHAALISSSAYPLRFPLILPNGVFKRGASPSLPNWVGWVGYNYLRGEGDTGGEVESKLRLGLF